MKTKKNRIALCMAVLMLLTSLSCGTTVSAAESETRGGDISQTAVTQLTVLPSSIDDGRNVTVRVEFDETGGNIQNGDTILITWPSSGAAYLMGYSKTVPLTINGQVVGEAIIARNTNSTPL